MTRLVDATAHFVDESPAIDTRPVTATPDNGAVHTSRIEGRPVSLAERVQREHELLRAYQAAQLLVERLEMAGRDPTAARAIRDGLSGSSAGEIEQTVDLIRHDNDKVIADVVVVDWPPYQPFSTSSPDPER